MSTFFGKYFGKNSCPRTYINFHLEPKSPPVRDSSVEVYGVVVQLIQDVVHPKLVLQIADHLTTVPTVPLILSF